jgi:site-specific DNA-methyltransferase (adenine-specific)
MERAARKKSEETRRRSAEKKNVTPAAPLEAKTDPDLLALDYQHFKVGRSMIVHADCFEWLSRIPPNSIHAIVTDPPYGVKEYDFDQLEKRSNGNGGIWRIPPSFDGHERAPLPRFTALNEKERAHLRRFFIEWAKVVVHALAPGGHVFVASNAFLSQLVFTALIDGGLEFRSQLVRIVRTLRGGDRPKNAEEEFPGVSSLPRGCYEPWGILRKPMPTGMKVSDCLRQYKTGGLRRTMDDGPFEDVIFSERTPAKEREIANHPSLKPQSLLREIVHAALPLGEGIIVDTFSGSGSTVAAADALGLRCIGIERHQDYYDLSKSAAPKLAGIETRVMTAGQLRLL